MSTPAIGWIERALLKSVIAGVGYAFKFGTQPVAYNAISALFFNESSYLLKNLTDFQHLGVNERESGGEIRRVQNRAGGRRRG
jgi:hypothetical protein